MDQLENPSLIFTRVNKACVTRDLDGLLLKGDFDTPRFCIVIALHLRRPGDLDLLRGNAGFAEQVAHGQRSLPCQRLVSAGVAAGIVKAGNQQFTACPRTRDQAGKHIARPRSEFSLAGGKVELQHAVFYPNACRIGRRLRFD
jgi:hypothetical protein